jgi:hypothetical protein
MLLSKMPAILAQPRRVKFSVAVAIADDAAQKIARPTG